VAIVVFSAQDNEFFRVPQALLVALVMGGVHGSWRFRYHYHTTLQTVQLSKSTCLLGYPTRLRPCSRHPVFTIQAFLSTRRMPPFLADVLTAHF
jgi:hypothetical protein